MLQADIQGNMSQHISYEPPKTKATKFVEKVKEGRKTIIMDNPMALQQMMQGGMPAEAAAMLQQMQGGAAEAPAPATPDLNLPPDAAAMLQQMLGSQQVEANPEAGADMIRKRPEYLERAMQEAASRDRFAVDIENSTLLDLYVNQSTREDVIKALSTLSSEKYSSGNTDPILYFSDVGLNFYFDENNVLEEIEIDEKYHHQTTKGLKIGDSIERAAELYGTPRMKSAKGAIWNRFSVLLYDYTTEIKLIRLKIR